MDTTKEYILQCEKAVEVQENHIIKETNVYAFYTKKGNEFVSSNCLMVGTLQKEQDLKYSMVFTIPTDYTFGIKSMSNFIWLPTQDQLQGMLIDQYMNPINILKDVYNFKLCKDENIFKSMEQLWLAFVMKEKFNKTWNGKDWE